MAMKPRRGLIVILPLIVGCGEASAPRVDPVGTYGLQEIDGEPPPVLFFSSDCYIGATRYEWSFWWAAGHLEFREDGTGELTRRVEERCGDQWSVDYPQAWGFTYSADGPSLSIAFDQEGTSAEGIDLDGPVLRLTFNRGASAYYLRFLRR